MFWQAFLAGGSGRSCVLNLRSGSSCLGRMEGGSHDANACDCFFHCKHGRHVLSTRMGLQVFVAGGSGKNCAICNGTNCPIWDEAHLV